VRLFDLPFGWRPPRSARREGGFSWLPERSTRRRRHCTRSGVQPAGWRAQLNPRDGKRDLAAVFKADEWLWRLVAEVEPADPLEGVPHADKLRKADANWARALGLEPQAPRPRTAKTLSGWPPNANDAFARVRSVAVRIHQAMLAFDPDDPAKEWTWPGLAEVGLFARDAEVLSSAGYKAKVPAAAAKPTARPKTPGTALPADKTERGEGDGGGARQRTNRALQGRHTTGPSGDAPLTMRRFGGPTLPSRCAQKGRPGRKSPLGTPRSILGTWTLRLIPSGSPSNASTPNRNKSGLCAPPESDGNRKPSPSARRKWPDEGDLRCGGGLLHPKEPHVIRGRFSSVVAAFRCNPLPGNHLRLSGLVC
jgi:hypothetical protein